MHQIILDKMNQVPMNEVPIVEIFASIEGEGIFIGLPQIFVRVGGCPVGCVNCDSKNTWKVKDSDIRSTSDVISEISSLFRDTGISRLSITGGEPAIYTQQVLGIATALRTRFSWINMETSGEFLEITKDSEFKDLIDCVSFDLKPPSSEVCTSDDQRNQIIDTAARVVSQIKCPVSDETDLDWLKGTHIPNTFTAPIVITPAVDPTITEPADVLAEHQRIFEMVQRSGSHISTVSGDYPLRFIPQIHKLYHTR